MQLFGDSRTVRFDAPYEALAFDSDRMRHYDLFLPYPYDYSSQPKQDHVPLYFPLPERFLGDRIGSYNGFLRFK